MPGSFPGWIANVVHEFGFDRAKAAFHRGIVPTISLAAHRLDDGGSIEDLAVIRGGILADLIDRRNAANLSHRRC